MKKSISEPSVVIIVLVFVIIPCILCYPNYKDKIPNGHNVKNPYDKDGSKEIWRGVGHWSLEGGGERNPFGLAFAGNSKVNAINMPIYTSLWGSLAKFPIKFSRIPFGANIQLNIILVKITVPKTA